MLVFFDALFFCAFNFGLVIFIILVIGTIFVFICAFYRDSSFSALLLTHHSFYLNDHTYDWLSSCVPLLLL